MNKCLWFLLLCIVAFSGCGNSEEQDNSADDRRYAEIILKKGGKFTVNGQRQVDSPSGIPDKNFVITGIDFNGTDIGDKDLDEISGLRNLTYLGLHSTTITDKSMLAIKNLTNLEELEISYTALTNDAVDGLVQLKKLKKLYLTGTNISDHGFVRLKDELPNCKQINLMKKKSTNSQN